MSGSNLNRFQRLASQLLAGPCWGITAGMRICAPLQVRRRQHRRGLCRLLPQYAKVVASGPTFRNSCTYACGAEGGIVGRRLQCLARGIRLGHFIMSPFLAAACLRICTLVCLSRFCYGQCKTPQLAPTCHANAPSERGLIARAVFIQIQARCAIGSSSVTSRLAFLTCKTVVCCSSRRCSSPPLPWRARRFLFANFSALNLTHCICYCHSGDGITLILSTDREKVLGQRG